MERTIEATDFASVLRQFRLAARLSQEQLAERARLSVESVSALERGRRRAPYRETVRMLADALRLSDPQRIELENAAKRSTAVSGVRNLDSDARHNLTRPVSSFYGREDDLTRLRELLANRRIVTIVGAGGMGKTRLALELAWQHLSNYNDGVWFVDLSVVPSNAHVMRSIVSTLRLPDAPDSTDDETLVRHLRDRSLLLIMDNCEHVIDEASKVIAALARQCPSIAVLATSREQLNIEGEFVYRIASLGLPPERPDSDHPSGADSPAVALFVERSAAAGTRADLSGENAIRVAAAICRRLEGIPLALELAATRAAFLTLPEILDQLQTQFEILGAANRDALPRHQTMRSTIEWSYNLLSEREQSFLRRLAPFVNGFTLAAAADFCADLLVGATVVDLVASVVNKSLVVADAVGASTRYRLHEPVFSSELRPLCISRAQPLGNRADRCVDEYGRAGNGQPASGSPERTRIQHDLR